MYAVSSFLRLVPQSDIIGQQLRSWLINPLREGVSLLVRCRKLTHCHDIEIFRIIFRLSLTYGQVYSLSNIVGLSDMTIFSI